MLLANKMLSNGGDPISGAVAKAFAREGVQIFIGGSQCAQLNAIAEAVRADGGTAHHMIQQKSGVIRSTSAVVP